jgi:hypothetical protein
MSNPQNDFPSCSFVSVVVKSEKALRFCTGLPSSKINLNSASKRDGGLRLQIA